MAEAKKAEDIVVYDLTEVCGFTDYFVICSGDNRVQVKAIADEIFEQLKRRMSNRIIGRGGSESEWILLDYNQIVVHVFTNDTRRFFALDTIWGDGQRVEVVVNYRDIDYINIR